MLTVTQFRQRFRPAEKHRIYTVAREVVDVQIYLDDLASAGERGVDVADPRTIEGVQALAAAGLLDDFETDTSAARVAAILATAAPEPSAPPTEAFGFTSGQQVRVLAPFAHAFPEVQVIDTFTDAAVQLQGGAQFAPHFLEAV